MNCENSFNDLNYNKYRIKRLYSELNDVENPSYMDKKFKYHNKNEFDYSINNSLKKFKSNRPVYNIGDVEMDQTTDNIGNSIYGNSQNTR